MALIYINDVKPEMILAADLKSPQGRLLLPKGTVLNKEHLRLCKIWGVYEAEIDNASSEVEDNSDKLKKIDQKIIDASEALADSRFLLANREHPVMQCLIKLFLMRVSQRMAQDGNEFAPRKERLMVDDPAPSGFHHTPFQKFHLADLEEAGYKLASLPDIFMQINEALNSPKSSASYVADIISKDTNLSAKLLKLVNSSFYGFPKQIDSLSRAVTILGSKQLLTLAVGVSVIRLFKDIPAEFIDMKSFCKHSIVCGILAGLIATQTNQSFSEERFFVGGLLHDIGRLFMLTNNSQMAQEALFVSRQQKTELVPTESRLWGFNHATIAGELFRIWKFPATLEAPVRYHHNPLKSQPSIEPGIIHLADIIAHSLDMGESGNWFVPALEPEIWEMTGLSENIIPFLVNRTDQKISDIMQVLFFKKNQ